MDRKRLSHLAAVLKGVVAELEAAGGGEEPSSSRKKSSLIPTGNETGRNGFSGPSGGIKMLITDGFFKQPQSLASVLERLKKEGYNYRKQVVSTALVRLVRQRLLTRVESTQKDSREKWNYAERK